MKKNLALLITVIALFSCLYYVRLNKEKDGLIRGNKITEFLYEYKLNPEEQEWAGYYLKDDNIYYLLHSENKYNLYQRNIYIKDNVKKQEFNNNASCNLVNDYIQCISDNKITIYNYEYKKLYETEVNDSEDYPKIIKYKDTFLKYKNNNLYLNQNQKESLFQELPEELNSTFIEDYYIEKSNTYLLLFNLKDNIHYIYDINKKEIKEVISKNSYKYNNGFYFYDKNKYQIINLKDQKDQEYPNMLENEYHYTSYLDKEKTLYYFNIIEDEINILDLETSIIKKIKIDLTKDNNISDIKIYKNYMYITIQDYNGTIFLLDLEKVEYEEENIGERIKKEEEELTNIVNDIKEKNNISIYIKNETNIKFPDFKAENENNNQKIKESLNKITNILNKYDHDFFASFNFDKYEGLHLYLTSKLTPSDLENQISNPAAYSLINDNKFMIVIDINQPNIEELLCHELIHNLEFVLTKKKITPFNNWESYNPEDFIYNNSYTKPYLYNYTIEEENKDQIYFIDKYSHTYASEDRARIFENICSCNENSVVKEYPNIYKKALYLEEEIYKYYPNLQKTSLFNSLK